MIFTGSELEHKPLSKLAQQGFKAGFKRLAQTFSVYLVGRKPNLPQGYTAKELCLDAITICTGDQMCAA